MPSHLGADGRPPGLAAGQALAATGSGSQGAKLAPPPRLPHPGHVDAQPDYTEEQARDRDSTSCPLSNPGPAPDDLKQHAVTVPCL